MVARQRRPAAHAARLVLHAYFCRSEERGHGLHAEHGRVSLDGRRQDAESIASAAWRSSRLLDRSAESESHDQRKRWRGDDLGRWRQELVHGVQPADGAVLPRRGGQRNTPPSYETAGGYACGLILQRAIEQAGGIDSAKVAEALNATDVTTFYGRTKFSTAAN